MYAHECFAYSDARLSLHETGQSLTIVAQEGDSHMAMTLSIEQLRTLRDLINERLDKDDLPRG